MTKVCPGCKRELPLDHEHYHVDTFARSGFKSRCRDCRGHGRSRLPVDAVPEGFEVREVATNVDSDGDTKDQWLSARPEREMHIGLIEALPEGHYVKGVTTLLDESGNVIMQYIKSATGDEHAPVEIVLDAIRQMQAAREPREPTAKPAMRDDDLLCIYPMGDPHFGMYAWAAETGDDYDLQLATQYHVEAMRALVDSAPAASTALVVDLGDFFHMDDSTNVTPRGHHQLDVDTRRPKVARAGINAMIALIDLTLRKHARVIVWCLRGNHDEDSTTMLQLALALYYKDEPRVHVEESPAIAYYLQFGENLVGSTHTHTVKDRASLGEMMASHRKVEWGSTSFRYWYCGHVHHDSMIETRGGVIVETMRTLAAKDKYAADNFYNAGRDMKCDVLHRVDGRITRNTIGIRQIVRQLKNKG